MPEYRVATLAQVVEHCAKKKVLMEMTYNGVTRLVEPYSYRTTKNGDVLLYAYCHKDQTTESFRVDRIEANPPVRATETKFDPRWTIEIGADNGEDNGEA